MGQLHSPKIAIEQSVGDSLLDQKFCQFTIFRTKYLYCDSESAYFAASRERFLANLAG